MDLTCPCFVFSVLALIALSAVMTLRGTDYTRACDNRFGRANRFPDRGVRLPHRAPRAAVARERRLDRHALRAPVAVTPVVLDDEDARAVDLPHRPIACAAPRWMLLDAPAAPAARTGHAPPLREPELGAQGRALSADAAGALG